MLVEQAIFTSAKTPRGEGYQLVARSPGLVEADARELAEWGPSHHALADKGPNAVSFNFFPLPSGAYCASRTTPAGGEYSQRSGPRIYTQCLVVSPDLLARFANNPLAVLKAALADGHLRVMDESVLHLPALQLTGRASAVDRTTVDRARSRFGHQRLVALVEAVLTHPRLVLAGGPPDLLFAAALNCLPPECRCEFSFSTGLTFSRRRPFRLLAAPGDPAERRQLARDESLTLWDISSAATSPAATSPAETSPAETSPVANGWARFVLAALSSERPAALAAQFTRARPGLSATDLDQLGHELADELAAWTERLGPSGNNRRATVAEPSSSATAQDKPAAAPNDSSLPAATDWAAPAAEATPAYNRAHSAHVRFDETRRTATAAAKAEFSASVRTSPSSQPGMVEKLEALDDLVFDAIDGNAEALAQLQAMWPQILAELGSQALEESREQYLRHAVSVWTGQGDPVSQQDDRVSALDVLTLLLAE
jgi:hypothetical protein